MATIRCRFRLRRIDAVGSAKDRFRRWRTSAIESWWVELKWKAFDSMALKESSSFANMIWICPTVELAMIMDRLYGGVCYAGIDTDPELKYPKVRSIKLLVFLFELWYNNVIFLQQGAGRVAFSNQQSYIAAISARFVQLQHGDIDKRVEVKPYVLDDQMCDECQGSRCGGKFAPFFCANVTCLQVLNRVGLSKPSKHSILVSFLVLLWALLDNNSLETGSRIPQAACERRCWPTTCRAISLVLTEQSGEFVAAAIAQVKLKSNLSINIFFQMNQNRYELKRETEISKMQILIQLSSHRNVQPFSMSKRNQNPMQR